MTVCILQNILLARKQSISITGPRFSPKYAWELLVCLTSNYSKHSLEVKSLVSTHVIYNP